MIGAAPPRGQRNGLYLIAALTLATSCSGLPIGSGSTPIDVITPKAADSLASNYAIERLQWIQVDETDRLRKNEVSPALDMDLDLAKEQAVFNQSAPLPSVSSATSYVSHQSSYPATFLSVLRFSDGTGAIMGFTRNVATAPWQLEVYASEPTPNDLGLSKASDGFTPQPFSNTGPTYAFAKQFVYYLNQRCTQTSPCQSGARMTSPPPGYQPGIVSGAIVDGHINDVAQEIKSYNSAGLSMSYEARESREWTFPSYQAGGGSLVWFSIVESFSVSARQQGRCFTVAQSPQTVIIDRLVPNGVYRAVTEHQEILVALRVPETNGPGQLTTEGALSAIQGNSVTNC